MTLLSKVMVAVSSCGFAAATLFMCVTEAWAETKSVTVSPGSSVTVSFTTTMPGEDHTLNINNGAAPDYEISGSSIISQDDTDGFVWQNTSATPMQHVYKIVGVAVDTPLWVEIRGSFKPASVAGGGGGGMPAKLEFEVHVPNIIVAMKLEVVGNIVVEPANKYSENATIKVTAVDGANGNTLTWFTGDVGIAEDGTTIYTQNGGTLPASVTISSGGTVQFVAKSLASAKVAHLQKPDPAKIKTTNFPIYGGVPLSVPQWVDNNSNGRVDWCEQWSDKILHDAQAAGSFTEKGFVTSFTTAIIGDIYEDGLWGIAPTGGPLPAIGTVIQVNPAATGHRLNNNRRLEQTVLHEARHVYQRWLIRQWTVGTVSPVDNDAGEIFHSLLNDPNNDDDPGVGVLFDDDGDTLWEVGVVPFDQAGSKMWEGLILTSGNPLWKGDGVKDSESLADAAAEMDADDWANSQL